MFKNYGVIGILLVILVELNFFFKIQPFANFYFPIVWFGYILIVDALVYKLKGSSLISNRFRYFLGMLIISVIVWWLFELINISINNWNYISSSKMSDIASIIMRILAYSTVIPAFFETVELVRCIHLFDKKKLHKKHKITKMFLHVMIFLGFLSFFVPIFIPAFTFPLVWLSFFFILDPINYLHNQPSIIKHIKDRKLVIPLSLLLAGIILGFLWEFWNYWAVRKWVYNIPFVGFFKIFEMPLLGYLGYFPFAFELYVMYWFVRSLFVNKESLLVD